MTETPAKKEIVNVEPEALPSSKGSYLNRQGQHFKFKYSDSYGTAELSPGVIGVVCNNGAQLTLNDFKTVATNLQQTGTVIDTAAQAVNQPFRKSYKVSPFREPCTR